MRRAVVVGAGIGGVTAAVALGRIGWQVTVLERAPELGEVGAGISIWPPAMEILDGLGAAERLGEASVDALQAGVRRPDGKWLVHVRPELIRVPTMVHRARLHEAIRASFTPDTEVRTGTTVTGVTVDGVVTTEAGERFEADLVVAADGLRSAIRSSLYPSYGGPRYAGYTAYRGVSALRLPDEGGETWGPGQRFGYVPLVDGRVYWYATANVPERSPVEDGHSADALRLFADWHDPISAVIEETPADGVLRNDLYDLTLPLVPFATGRVALLGDAAHAMTPNLGQGACSAIEDAGTLVRMLQEYDDVPRALTSYDAERRPATAKLVRRSRLVGAIGQFDNAGALTVRDAILTVAGKAASLIARRRSR